MAAIGGGSDTPGRRVADFLAAARRGLVDGGMLGEPQLRARLVEETGLSAEGVAYALESLLGAELKASEEDVGRFVASARRYDAVAVILASNVFIAPLRAIAWALAQAPRVVVRASRRGGGIVEALAAATGAFAMLAPGEPTNDLASLLESLPTPAAVHVYGGEETMRDVEAAVRAREGVSAELHGPGFGVVVGSGDALCAHAREIALDVAAFDQRGCLSPRVVLALGDVPASRDVADALHAALAALDETLPRGALSPGEQSEVSMARQAAVFAGRAMSGAGHEVLDLGDAPGVPVGPVGRVVSVVAVRSIDDAIARLGPYAALSTVGAAARHADRLASAFPLCRVTPLGAMQRPPFDGPVDRRAARRCREIDEQGSLSREGEGGA